MARNEFSEMAAKYAAKYPNGYLTEIEIGFPCKCAIRAPVRGLDSPRAIFTGDYQDLREFGLAWQQFRGVA